MAAQLNGLPDAPVKILLVDDKEENLFSIESIFDEDEYIFIKARSGKEALKILLKEDDFSLILLDVQMPELNGYDTASLIYRREKMSHIPIIFITANSYNEANLYKGYKSGAVDYIFKPINPDLLKAKVSVFIDLFKKNRQLFLQEQYLKKINQNLENEIEEKKKIENELLLKNLQLSEAQKISHLGYWDWDILSNKISCSEECYSVYEFSTGQADLSMEDILNKVSPQDIELVKNSIAASISNKSSFDIFFKIILTEGRTKFINQRGKVIVNARNEISRIFGTIQDLTDWKKTEEQIKIFNLLERVLSEIYILDAKTLTFIYANEDALRNSGFNLDELNVHNIFALFPEYDLSTFADLIKPLFNNAKEKVVFYSKICRKDSSCYPVEVHLQLLEQGDNDVFLAVVQDLTEREKTEQLLSFSLKEKETLLKEIHHRVKNNLQIINSLLNLQSNLIPDERIVEIFKESQSRIRSMALIHEKLYQHNNLSFIDFTEYIASLTSAISLSYNNKNSIIINAEPLYLNMDLSLSLGLCLNELITNSIKYAFPPNKPGEIIITLKLIENRLEFKVSDNGIGFPENYDFENSESLGLKLVYTMVEQNNGRLVVNRNGLTEFNITIPVNSDSVSREGMSVLNGNEFMH